MRSEARGKVQEWLPGVSLGQEPRAGWLCLRIDITDRIRSGRSDLSMFDLTYGILLANASHLKDVFGTEMLPGKGEVSI